MSQPFELIVLDTVPVFVRDQKNTILYWARGMENLYGWTQAEVLGKNSHQVLQTVFPQPLGEIEQALEEQGEWSGDLLHTKKDGFQVIVNSTWFLRANEGGETQTIIETNLISKQNQTNDVLYKVAREWRTTFDSMTDAICLLDVDQKILRCNRAMSEMFKKEYMEIIGQPCWAIMHGTSEPISGCPMVRMKKTLQREMMELKIGEHSFLVTVDPILDENHILTGAVHAIRDITKRKRIEEMLRESEERLELFFAQSLDGFFFMMLDEPVYWGETVDKDQILEYVFSHQRVTKANDAFLAQYGATREEYLGQTPEALFAHNLEAGKQVWREFFDKGQLHTETEERKLDGTPIWIEGDYICMYDAEGRITGHFGVQRDITERKQIEQQMRFQSDLLISVQDAVIGTDEFYNIIYWNETARNLYGWNSDEVIGRPMGNFIQNEYLQGGLDDVLHQITQKGYWKGEVNQNHRDGRKIPILASVSSVKDAEGKPVGFIAVNRNISDRKQVEDELRRSEEKFSGAFHASPAGMTITRISDGTFIDANDAFLGIFEFNREEVIGHISTELDMWTPEERKNLIQKQLESEGLQAFELQARSKTGKIITIMFSSRSLEIEGEACHITTMIDITERKQAEQALRKSEQYNRLLFDLSPIGLALCRMDGSLVDVNPAYCAIIGRSVEETLSLTYWDITPEKYAEEEDRQLEALYHSGRYSAYEKEYIHADGHLVPVRLNGLLIERDGEKFIWSSVEDITERKQAEGSLQKSEEILRLFIENAPASIAMFDREMKYIAVSDRYISDYKLDDKNIIGRSHYDIFPEIPESWKEIHRHCLAGAVEKRDQDPFPRADGSLDWIRWEIHPWRDVDNEIGGIILFSEVITQQIQDGENLRESEFRYRQLLDVSPVGVAVHVGGKIAFANPAGAEILGAKTAQELIEKPITEIIHPDGLKQAAERIQRLLSGEKGLYPAEDRYVRLDGSVIPVEVMAVPLTYGDKPAVQVMVTDITERKRAEAEIRRRAEELAALNALGRTVSQSLVLDQVVTDAVKEIARAVQPDLAFLFLREGEQLLLKAVTPSSGTSTFEGVPQHRVGECMCGLAVREGKALYSQDIFRDARCTWEECKKAGLRSFAALPLHSGEEIIGVIGLAAQAERDFELQSEFLTTLTRQVATGLQNVRLYEDARRRMNELTVIYQAAQRLQQIFKPQMLAQQIIEIMETLVNYEFAAVLLIEKDSDNLKPFAISDQGNGSSFVQQDKTYIESRQPRLGRGIAGWVAENGQSILSGDVREDPRYFAIRSDIRSELCVPLRIGETVIGVLNIETSRPNAYTEADQRLLETVGTQIAAAIQNARLLEELHENAAELEARVEERTAKLERSLREQAAAEERQHLARELHDTVSQTLFSASLIAESLLRLPPDEAQLISGGLNNLQRLTRGALAEMRTLLLELRPGAIEQVSLNELLNQLASGLMGRTSLDIEIETEGIRILPVDVRLVLFRITQEALNNIVKHAHAKNVRLHRLDLAPASIIEGKPPVPGVSLTIRDNGRGFDPRITLPGHHGLAIMRERIESIGGSLEIKSKPGQGTEVILTWRGNFNEEVHQ